MNGLGVISENIAYIYNVLHPPPFFMKRNFMEIFFIPKN